MRKVLRKVFAEGSRGRFLRQVHEIHGRFLRKVFAEGSAEGFLEKCAQNCTFCGSFLRKFFAEGSAEGFAEGFCGRFRGR